MAKRWFPRAFALVVVSSMVVALTLAALDRRGGPHDVPIRGADISFTLQEEAIGQHVRSDDGTAPIEQILAQHGATHARLRVWVGPEPGTSDLESALALARRAEATGMRILLNLHYSDTWADRRSQQTPSAWDEQDFEQLRATVRSYTREVVADFAQQGTPVDMVQIGNEVTCGMLWPQGSLCGPTSPNWDAFAELLAAGAEGAREGNRWNPPSVMVHIDTGGDFESSASFFDHLVERQVDFDLIGLTYYPFWHGPLSSLEHNLAALAHRYGKGIVIAETAYPWTLSTPGPSVVETADALPDAPEFPATPEGQAAYFEELNRVVRAVPGNRVLGYFVWEPGWLPGVDAAPGVGNTHGNLTLFDWEGRGLPALDAFRPRGTSDE